MKLYGSLNNRMEENKMYCSEIKVGTGMTRYDYTDRHAYEVVKVIDQTNVFVREYDHIADGPAMSNMWKLVPNEKNPVIELKLKNGVWYRVLSYTKEAWLERAAKDNSFKTPEAAYNYYKFISGLTEKQLEKVENGKTVKTLRKFGNVSFGVADYHFDYEF
jgi:hypothetical protein